MDETEIGSHVQSPLSVPPTTMVFSSSGGGGRNNKAILLVCILLMACGVWLQSKNLFLSKSGRTKQTATTKTPAEEWLRLYQQEEQRMWWVKNPGGSEEVVMDWDEPSESDDEDDDSLEEEEDDRRDDDDDDVQRVKGLSDAAMQQWCPFAQCHVTDLCHPCQRRYLILIATGRSASTTLKEMLNALPGVRLAGENNGLLGNLLMTFDATMQDKRWKRQTGNSRRGAHPSWSHHAYPMSAWACVTQQAVETLVPPPNDDGRHQVDRLEERHDIVGFKTIRFPPQRGNSTEAELERAVEFLTQQAFPCSRILINYRSDVEAQARSKNRGWTKGNTQIPELLRETESTNRVLQQLAQQLGPERAFLLDSEAWTRNVTVLNDMISSWLGFDLACHFAELFEFNTRRRYEAGFVTGRNNPAGCVPLPH